MDYTLAGTVILSGMGIVFLVLVILTLVVMALGRIMGRAAGSQNTPPAQEKAPQPAPAPKAQPASAVRAQEGIPQEIIAVISASVAAAMGGKPFAIRSVRRAAPGHGRGRRSPWSAAGLQQNTNPF